MTEVSSTSKETRPFWAISGLALSGMLALSACAPDESAEFDDTETEATSETEETETPETAEEENNDDDSQGTPASESEGEDAESGNQESDEDETSTEDEEARSSAGSAQDVLDQAQETITYSLPEVDGEMTMGIQELTASEEGMLLTVTFVPEYDDSDELMTLYQLHGRNETLETVLLPGVNDRENFKQYFVPMNHSPQRAQGWVSAGNDAWATQLGGVGLASGEPFTLWAYFATPEDEVDTVDVSVVPGAEEFRDVEITWADELPDEDSASDDTDEDDSAEDDDS